MRRITFTIVTTLAILVLLFSYRTSRNESIIPKTVAVGQAHVVLPPTAPSAVASASGPDPAASQPAGRVTVPSSAPAAGQDPTSVAPTTNPAAPPTSSHAASPTTSSSALSVTVDGAAVGTRFGDVQVEVVIDAGTITDVRALTYPTEQRRDQEINQIAIPELRSQVLAAQSANIAGVGGATYTTEGYISSLQSALDQVHFQ